ncbi:MmcB family DNA repair protein [Leptospira sp. GIMC2001]|uniref:MmcB family DNA repair protein n=1 Tax=Leptospira sp. GIMC2001 TaxID=1513297 RepID=UPI0023495EC8|nr:MmcB family DNA repair protein [Leptospira sp. GIMC2001]WCL51448.1 MmcB family DNA repair protein [Leptospira sp. GIMC2001]
MNISSYQILELLKKKHQGQNDVFLSELNTGEARSGTTRMDAWVMPRSWVKPECTAYEIKVSRSDFKKDEKWQTYLPYCNYLYFVAPPGIIDPSELPPEAGLYITSTNGQKLFKKKLSVRRSLEIPQEMFRLALMRCEPSRSLLLTQLDKYDQKQRRLQELEEYLSEKRILKERGAKLGKSIRELIKCQILEVREENKSLRTTIEELKHVMTYLESIGFTESQLKSTDPYYWRYKVLDKVKEFNQAVPEGFIKNLKELESSSKAIIYKLENLRDHENEKN